MARLVDIDVLVLRNLVVWVEVGTGVERQRCQPSFGPVSLFAVLVSPSKEKRLGCQADFGLVSPPDDLMSHDIAGKGPQQIENAAPVACGVTASWEVSIFYVDRRM